MFQRQKVRDNEVDLAHIDASLVERRLEWGDGSNVEATDEELIEHLAGGDLAALDGLYTRYARPVFSLALRILTDSADAEEVTQDVFERVWRHAPTFDAKRGRFGTWLMSMTHHVAIDRVRKRQRRPQQIAAEAAEWTLPHLPNVSDASESALRNVQAEHVRRALRSLPDSQQQAIELAYFGGLSHLEIAAVLGDPLGTVKARIRRGMDRLRSALERFVTEDESV
jgi:RNA polymerase sigma-70 factor (ECF subfamily)